jgi:hypothetical protein
MAENNKNGIVDVPFLRFIYFDNLRKSRTFPFLRNSERRKRSIDLIFRKRKIGCTATEAINNAFYVFEG